MGWTSGTRLWGSRRTVLDAQMKRLEARLVGVDSFLAAVPAHNSPSPPPLRQANASTAPQHTPTCRNHHVRKVRSARACDQSVERSGRPVRRAAASTDGMRLT